MPLARQVHGEDATYLHFAAFSDEVENATLGIDRLHRVEALALAVLSSDFFMFDAAVPERRSFVRNDGTAQSRRRARAVVATCRELLAR